MADNYANLSALQRFWAKAKDYIDTALGLKLDSDAYATDSDYGIVKTNSAESVTLNASGQLDVGGRLGQMPSGTGIYNPKSIVPAAIGDGSFLLTEGSGTSLGTKSLAVSTGQGVTCRSAAAGATEYHVTNTYENRIKCAALSVAGGVLALNENAAKEGKFANVLSVQIDGATYVPDSSPNVSDTAHDIIVAVDATINPDSSTTSIRVYPAELGFSTLFVGQSVGSNGGASVVVGQGVMNFSGNACALVGASMYNHGNGNGVFGRQHISRKNRWFMSGTGHDNTNGKSESGAALGQWSNITSNTALAYGNGTSHTARSNSLELLNDGRLKISGTPSEADDVVTKGYADANYGGGGGGPTVTTYGNADFTYQQVIDPETGTVTNECVAYSTVAGNANEPTAVKYGRIVNLAGAFKNINARPDNSAFDMGKVPTGCEPAKTQYILQQGTSQYKFMLTVRPDGTLNCSRYSTGSSAVAVPNNAWLNVNATYISAT